MFDVKEVEKQAREELATERATGAKAKIKSHLAKIEAARKIVANLEEEYAVLLRDIGV
jgi:GTP1/Obg family GTP-binding protein